MALFDLRADDLVDVEEAVLLEADLDERRLHPRQDVVDLAEIDVARDRAVVRPLEIDLGGLAVLEHGDTLLADVDGDEQLALRGRERGAALRLTAAALLGPGRGGVPAAGRAGGFGLLGGLLFARARLPSRRLRRPRCRASCVRDRRGCRAAVSA